MISICQTAVPVVAQRRPAVLRALGDRDLPEVVEVDGQLHRLVETFKHDTWAATGLYVAGNQQLICKFNREHSILGFPGGWIGRFLGNRERTALRLLAGIVGIPRERGPVIVNGQVRPNAVAREFIPGRVISGQDISGPFLNRLGNLLNEVHARHVAYVDLHKTENVLMGDDGLPYLFDFQISYALPTGLLGRLPPLRWLLICLQRSDDYHLLKHKLRLGQSSDVTPRDIPWWIQLHRCIAVPWRSFRRRLLVALQVRTGNGSVTSEAQPEMAFQQRS
jgi:hypothetical protein